MDKKSEVQAVLDAVAGFNNSIQTFRDSIKDDIIRSEERLKSFVTVEINRTNEVVKEIKLDVEELQKNAHEEKTLLRVQKFKLGVAISIAVFVLTPIIGIIQHFITKAFQ